MHTEQDPQAPTQALAPAAAGTVTADGSIGPDWTCALPAGNITMNMQGVRPGRLLAITYTQDGVGGRTVTYAGTQAVATPGTAADIQPAAGAAAVSTILFMGIDPTHVRPIGKLT